MNGLLGTRASFLSDLLLISLIILIPAFIAGFILARRHRGAPHRLIMLPTYGVIVVFVVIYIIHNFVEGFPPLRGSTFSLYNLVYLSLGLTHSFFAVAALIAGGYQLYTGYTFTSGHKVWSMSASQRKIHARLGHRALVFFALTAATGIFFYYWVFVNTRGY